jgi:uncharacterized damage-inducible protein DinB
MDPNSLISAYLSGPQQLRDAIRGMTPEQLNARPVPGKWSTRQVVCHIADFEPVYVDRMKRVIAQEAPTFFGGDPDLFAARLAYDARDLEEELQLIESCRRHMARILSTLSPEDFARTGIHSESGAMTLEKLLTNITKHVPHHIPFIEEKRKVLGC